MRTISDKLYNLRMRFTSWMDHLGEEIEEPMKVASMDLALLEAKCIDAGLIDAKESYATYCGDGMWKGATYFPQTHHPEWNGCTVNSNPITWSDRESILFPNRWSCYYCGSLNKDSLKCLCCNAPRKDA